MNNCSTLNSIEIEPTANSVEVELIRVETLIGYVSIAQASVVKNEVE